MAYVTITKDLTEVKDKVAFGLTKRQIVCFSLGGIAGVGTYFLTRHSLGNDLALLLLIALAAPFMLFGLYEKNGQPLEKILKNIIRVRLLAPAARPYQTNNRFAALGLQGFLIMICVGIYAVLVNALSLGGDLQASIWSCAAYTVLLCFSLFKTGSVAKSILNAH